MISPLVGEASEPLAINRIVAVNRTAFDPQEDDGFSILRNSGFHLTLKESGGIILLDDQVTEKLRSS